MAWNQRNDRIAVFDDTVKQYSTNEHLKKAVQKSIMIQQLILEGTEISGLWQNEIESKQLIWPDYKGNNGIDDTDRGFSKQRTHSVYKEDANIVVSKKRSFEAAQAYTGQKVCVDDSWRFRMWGFSKSSGSSCPWDL